MFQLLCLLEEEARELEEQAKLLEGEAKALEVALE